MTKKELLAAIDKKKQEVINLVAEDKVDEATTAKEELKTLQAKLDLIEDLEDGQKDQTQKQVNDGDAAPVDDEKNSIKAFANAARNGFRGIVNAVTGMTEGTPANGGYTVPEDIQTRINQYKSAVFSLLDLVDSESVTTNKGARTFQKRSQQTGFSKVSEGGKIGGKGGPQFERISYEIEKYAGYFPVTNELLEDSDANITETIVQWIAGESRATDNSQILTAIKTKTATELSNLDGIQKAIIVTLGAAFAGSSKIVTNDDGLLYLSTLKNTNGDYLLRNANNDPMKKVLAIGAMSVPVEVIGNDVLASNTATAEKRGIPFIIGDLKEGVKKFARKDTVITSSDIASVSDFNAFEQDMTLFRAIERDDYVVKDEEAFVNGVLTIDDTTVVGE